MANELGHFPSSKRYVLADPTSTLIDEDQSLLRCIYHRAESRSISYLCSTLTQASFSLTILIHSLPHSLPQTLHFCSTLSPSPSPPQWLNLQRTTSTRITPPFQQPPSSAPSTQSGYSGTPTSASGSHAAKPTSIDTPSPSSSLASSAPQAGSSASSTATTSPAYRSTPYPLATSSSPLSSSAPPSTYYSST